MKIRPLVYVAASMLPFVAGACGSKNAAPPHAAQSAQPGAVVITGEGSATSLPYAPSGTAFDVRLDQAVDTRLSQPGEAVTATLMQPILASDDERLVPEGTQLRGKIAAIYHSPSPRIVLTFDSLALRGGSVPVGIAVLAVQESRYRTLPSPPGVTSMQPAHGAQQPNGQGTDQISMAKGAVLKVSLTTPIVQARGL